MPAVSKKQQHLMAAAEHGANFPMARKVRQSMTHQQMHDFASTSTKGLSNKKKKRGPMSDYEMP
jgi:hypothetical protein